MHNWINGAAVLLSYSYGASLLAWALAQAFAPDRWWWLFLLSALAPYLFVPLLALPLLALLSGRHELWLLLGAGALLWGVCYGELFVPRRPPPAHGPALRVLSYNALRHNLDPAGVLAAIRAADADLVALQELNEPLAAALAHELAADYPYQRLQPSASDTSGMGLLSRFPLRAQPVSLPGRWLGGPQVAEVTVGGQRVLLVNVHLRSSSLGYGGNIRFAPTLLEQSIREREQQARTLAAFVRQHDGPLLLVGDLNTGDQSAAYATLARELRDAWRAAGHGLGHTFPGGNTPGTSRPAVLGVRVPQWLIRIDYIFCSRHWAVQAAHIGPWDGASDHRPVLAQLQLRQAAR